MDVVRQQMSRIEHCRSDPRQSSTDNADIQARKEDSKITPTVPGSSCTSETDCRTAEQHAMNTTRENAIASLIVLANLVPVC